MSDDETRNPHASPQPPRKKRRTPPTVEQLAEGVRTASPARLGQAITLVESRAPEHREQAQELLTQLMPLTGRAKRLGISGLAGAGKSTFVEELGTRLTAAGHRVAVLAVDPTSQVSGGSILGDKTRMPRLARDENAFIRPSPSAGTLGGVAQRTRESLLLCEAAGFDVVLVETVGVGQSEAAVAQMVDFFLVLLLAGGGDELQGIKRGVLELADMLAVTKADGDNVERAQRQAKEYEAALRYMSPAGTAGWKPRVLAISSKTGHNVDNVWRAVEEQRDLLERTGELKRKRERQHLHWMWQLLDEQLMHRFREHPDVQALLTPTQEDVVAGRLTPRAAAQRLLTAFGLRLDEES